MLASEKQACLASKVCLFGVDRISVLIWNNNTRRIWLRGICAMPAGIGLAMGRYLFALIMIYCSRVCPWPRSLIAREDQLEATGSSRMRWGGNVAPRSSRSSF